MIIRSIRKILRRNVTLKCLDGTTIEQIESKYLGVIIILITTSSGGTLWLYVEEDREKISFLNRIGRDISGYARCVVYKSIIALWILCYDVSKCGWNSIDKTASSTELRHASYIAMWQIYESGKNVASVAVYVVYETETILQCVYLFLKW